MASVLGNLENSLWRGCLATSWALDQWKINYSIGKLEFEYLPKKLCDNVIMGPGTIFL